MKPPESYAALALQSVCDAINQDTTPKDAQNRIKTSLERIAKEIEASVGWVKAFLGTAPKLVVLPEYSLTGFPIQESIQEWRDKGALEPDSAIHKGLGKIATDNNIFLAVNLYERNEIAPDHYFQSNLLFGPDSDIKLRYIRLISINTPTSFDFWDRYIEKVGMEGLFPVADTEIGRIAPLVSEEVLYPEVARAFALHGAEVFTHCTSEVCSNALTPKDIAKRARAIENSAYVISANSAGIYGPAMPAQSADGMSKIINPEGIVISETGQGPSMNVSGMINLYSLRAKRLRPAMTNLLPRLPAKAFAEVYAQAKSMQPNGLLHQTDIKRKWLRERISGLAKDFYQEFNY